MAGRKSDFTLTKLDDLFSTQEQRDEEKLSKIRDIPLTEIDDFPDHPFKVRDDEDMHNIRAVIVYTCIIPRVTISMFKIGFSQKGWTFSPRVVPDFFQARLFLFWAISDLGGFADDRNTSALTQ